MPNGGSLLRVTGSGLLTALAAGLDRPTSFEVIGNTAYVVTLAGEIWKVENIAEQPFDGQ
jgi:hypothetical protein